MKSIIECMRMFNNKEGKINVYELFYHKQMEHSLKYISHVKVLITFV